MPPAAATPGEGRLDPRRALSSSRPLRLAMVFVTPSDIVPAESTEALYASLAPAVERWFAAASYGRAKLDVTDPVDEWLPAASLDLASARAAAARAADLSGYDALIAVLPRETSLTASYADVLASGAPRFGVVLAPHPTERSPRAPELWQILVHELGHVLGLPDLYGDAGFAATPIHAGPWDPMSVPLGQNVLAWHAYELGWLDGSDLRCMAAGSSTTDLVAAGEHGGTKAVVVPLTPSSALVVEARHRSGLDAGLCDDGVLVYDVETDAVPKTPPIRVVSAASPDAGCGPLSGATLHAGDTLVDAGVRVDVLADTPGGYRVRVTR